MTLKLYLQLRDLLEGIQAELDHSTAVLDEVYGIRPDLGLNLLNLATRRIYSNLQYPAYLDSLLYVPDRTGFSADPNLLSLLVEPLYGKEPSVGVRELMQNAVDAVCELEVWCAAHEVSVQSLDLPEQEGDVLIEFTKRQNGSWFLRVRDRGIGMTADTIQNYFLRAGASFRRSSEWAKEFLDEKGQPRVIRSGRFGVGAFPIFLLGPSFSLSTRHAGAVKSMGYKIEASANSQLIEITRDHDLPVGTTIEAEISSESVTALQLEATKYSDDEGLQRRVDWFCWDWPKVVKRVMCGTEPELLDQQYACSIRKGELPPECSVIHPEGFDAVYWTFRDAPRLSCNGLNLRNSEFEDGNFSWPNAELRPPCIAVLDSAANLPLTIQRYHLSQETVPFIDELTRDVMLSVIAYALVCGPTSRAEALSFRCRHPLMLKPFPKRGHPFSHGHLRWCTTSAEMVPADAWLYSLLNPESCLVCGVFISTEISTEIMRDNIERRLLPSLTATSRCAVLLWDGMLASHRLEPGTVASILTELADDGVVALGHDIEASQVLIPADSELRFETTFADGDRRVANGDRRRAFDIWRHMRSLCSPERHWFAATKGTMEPCISLKSVIEVLEGTYGRRSSVCYAAEIRTKRVARTPESLIAKLWNEYLGARAIPFDATARKELIASGLRHPELKRHIEAWKKMKHAGYIWTAHANDAATE